jgi:hypothetical protein
MDMLDRGSYSQFLVLSGKGICGYTARRSDITPFSVERLALGRQAHWA